jgi:hypothetical protein
MRIEFTDAVLTLSILFGLSLFSFWVGYLEGQQREQDKWEKVTQWKKLNK